MQESVEIAVCGFDKVNCFSNCRSLEFLEYYLYIQSQCKRGTYQNQ